MASSDGAVGDGRGVGSSVGEVVGTVVGVGVGVVRQEVSSRAADRIMIVAANRRELGIFSISASSQSITSDLS
jgi:hypothetical protein